MKVPSLLWANWPQRPVQMARRHVRKRQKTWKMRVQEVSRENSHGSFRPALIARKYRKTIRSRPGKPNQRKGQNEKFMNFAHFCPFWCFSLGKQARFTLNFCSGMPPGKVHELAFLWFGLLGPLLKQVFGRLCATKRQNYQTLITP